MKDWAQPRLTRFRFNSQIGINEASCFKCRQWKPFDRFSWPKDTSLRTRLVCKECAERTRAPSKIQRKTINFDPRRGTINRCRCCTCKELKPTTSFYLIKGSKLTRHDCIACEKRAKAKSVKTIGRRLEDHRGTPL